MVPNWFGLAAETEYGTAMDGLWWMAEGGSKRSRSAIWEGCDWRVSA